MKKKVLPVDDDIDLFFQAVSDVSPFKRTIDKITHAIIPKKVVVEKRGEALRVIEDGAFLEEIGRLKLDTKFSDSIPNEDELSSLGGNRLRQVKRGIVTLEYQLDLHGLTRDEALEALPLFLQTAQKKGQKAVLVITGKGNHSADVPVLHQAVASWMRDTGRTIVLEFAPAPRDMGGNGAYVVFIRQKAVNS